MKVLSFDLSLTATGTALGVNGKILEYGLISGLHTGIRRLIYDRARVMDRVDEVKPDMIVIEALSFGSKGSAVHDQAGLFRSIEMEFVQDGWKYITVAPPSLKKFVCGSAGSAKNPVRKEHMLKYMFSRFGHDISDNNVADAIGLAYLGMAAIGDWLPSIDPQRDVLANIHKSNSWLKAMAKPVENTTLREPEAQLVEW